MDCVGTAHAKLSTCWIRNVGSALIVAWQRQGLWEVLEKLSVGPVSIPCTMVIHTWGGGLRMTLQDMENGKDMSNFDRRFLKYLLPPSLKWLVNGDIQRSFRQRCFCKSGNSIGTIYLVVVKGSNGPETTYVDLIKDSSVGMSQCYRPATGWGNVVHPSYFLGTVCFNKIVPDEE